MSLGGAARASLGAALLLAGLGPGAGRAADRFPEPVVAEVPVRAALRAFQDGSLSGTLTLPDMAAGERRPAVVVVHDANGADARADPYAEQLAAAGFLVLDLLSHPADAEAARRALAWLAAQPMVDPVRIAGLGFGAGAQAVLAAGFAARVLLYPGCARLPRAADAAPTLLAHGGRDPANAEPACRAAVDRLAGAGAMVRLIVYSQAGYAWDHPPVGPGGRVLLASPLGGERVPAEPWPALAEAVASEVAGFLAVALRR